MLSPRVWSGIPVLYNKRPKSLTTMIGSDILTSESSRTYLSEARSGGH